MVAEPMPMKTPIPVAVRASDPLSRAGIASQLRRAQGFAVVADGEAPEDSVALVVAEEVSPEVVAEMRALRGRGVRRIVLLVSRVDDRCAARGGRGRRDRRDPPERGDGGQPRGGDPLGRRRRGQPAARPPRPAAAPGRASSSARCCHRAG